MQVVYNQVCCLLWKMGGVCYFCLLAKGSQVPLEINKKGKFYPLFYSLIFATLTKREKQRKTGGVGRCKKERERERERERGEGGGDGERERDYIKSRWVMGEKSWVVCKVSVRKIR